MLSKSGIRSLKWTLSLVCVLVFTLNTFAQETGKIQGTVEDAETGQPLPGVNVYLVGTELGAATDAEGRYFIINIPVGTYDITASMIGYAQLTKTDVLVQIDRTSNVNFSLTTSAIEGEQVTVVAERDILHRNIKYSAGNDERASHSGPCNPKCGRVCEQAGRGFR